MRFIRKLLENSRFHSFMITIIACSLVWNLGQSITINKTIPLADPLHRIAVIIALFIFWGLSNLLIKHDKTLPHLISSQQDAFKILNSDLKTAKKLSKSNKKNWHVVFGLANSGKSTLLNCYTSGKNGSRQHSVSTLCEYWHTDNATFMDINSDFSKPDHAQNNIVILKHLFHKLKTQQITPAGVIITTDLINLANELEATDQQANSIRSVLQYINEIYPGVAISIIASKSDLTSGFTDFFDDMGPEERQQSCGIQFPAPPYDKPLPGLCDQEFSSLLARLNDRLIWRMHQESDVRKRHAIKQFPTQIESLKPNLGHLLNQILPSIDVTLSGIYFTSCSQTFTPIESYNIQNPQVASETDSNLPVKSQQKTFFVDQLFDDLSNVKQSVSAANSSYWMSYTTAAVAIMTILSGSFIYQNFHQNVTDMTIASNLLDRANQTVSKKPYKTVLAKLYAMQQTYNTLKQNHKKLSGNSKKQNELMMKQSQLSFWIILEQQFFPELNSTVTKSLTEQTTAEIHDYTQLFQTLSTYLMLHDPKHFNKQHISTWFQHYWEHQNISITDKRLLNRYLQLLLSQPLPQQQINFSLMLKSQEILKKKTPAEIAMVMINNHLNPHPVTLVSNHSEAIIEPEFNSIPSTYTQLQREDIMHNRIPEACKTISENGWIIDDAENVDYHRLVTQLQSGYLKQYSKTWSDTLNHVRYKPQSQFNDYLVTLNSLSTKRSPLLQLLEKIQENTQMIPNEPEFNLSVSSKFTAFNAINLHDKNNSVNRAVSALAVSMNAIGNAKNPIETAYAHARLRLTHRTNSDAISGLINVSKELPSPLKEWTNHVANDGWHFVLGGARNYLNAIWVQFVVPEYNQMINHRYPVFKAEKKDITLTNFSQFFSADGVIDTFYKNYLKEFVDEDNWAWRDVDGQNIGIPVATLENFLRARLIKKMLFANNHHQPFATFSMKQKAINPTIKYFSIMIDGQPVEYRNGAGKIANITWPNTDIVENHIKFTSTNGKATTLNFDDEWGWFRVLDLADIATTEATQTLQIVFKFAGQTIAQYELTSDSVINPFTPEVIAAFRCPSVL